MSRVIETSLVIGAPRSSVWSVLMNFDSYPSWNPFIRSIKGSPEVGQTLEVVIQPPGRKPDVFRPKVIAVDGERRLSWRGSLPIPGLFTGEHSFELRDDGDGSHFYETFSGLLVPFVGGVLDATEQGFRNMNDALKARAEGR
ncbi:MAG TPA: SRPBCC domain-containing protein [Hyphomicrobium sp.]